ncbi:MAG TPA: hypothetical protein VN538_07755 [Clostridia bacterium]|nr:hypothetical protein [Clostridia bacterium]
MLLEADYKNLVQFRNNKDVNIGDIDGLSINRLVEEGFLKNENIMGPNPEPHRMINGAYRDQIPVGHKLVISEPGIKALIEYEEKMGDKNFERANIRKANFRATAALIISFLALVSSILIALFK